jgi:hypothetical protein
MSSLQFMFCNDNWIAAFPEHKSIVLIGRDTCIKGPSVGMTFPYEKSIVMAFIPAINDLFLSRC